MNNYVYTIGHSTLSHEKFMELLRTNKIDCIVDVRSTPYSQYASQFNREVIKDLLVNNDIQYIYMGDEFGARRTDNSLYTDGIVDFTKVAKDPQFLHGIYRLKQGMAKNFTIAIMCTEKDPATCHRSILISHELDKLDIEVRHILDDNTIILQEKIDKILLNKYFPDRNQLSLFGNEEEKDLIEQSYIKQNKEIGYTKG